MAAAMPAEEDQDDDARSDRDRVADRFLDDLFGRLRAEVEPAVRDRVAHGLAPADRPTDELARMMAAPVPRRSAWDDTTGPFYDTTGVARLLGVSRQALQAQRQRGRLLALRTGDGQFLYPTWQFDERRQILAGLAAVLTAVPPGAIDGWTLAGWLRRSALAKLDGHSVVDHLRSGGDPEPAIVATRRAVARWVA